MSEHEIKQWAEKLDVLLRKGAVAAQGGDADEIAQVQHELRAFTFASPSYADALDVQAKNAIFDLDLGVAEQAIAGIKQRAAEVQRLSNLISGITKEANANASILRGEIAKEAIDAASEVVNSFKKLRDGLSKDDPDESALAGEIDKLLATVQKVRNRIEVA